MNSDFGSDGGRTAAVESPEMTSGGGVVVGAATSSNLGSGGGSPRAVESPEMTSGGGVIARAAS